MGEALEVSDSAILGRTTSTPSTPTSDGEISGVGDSRTPSGGHEDLGGDTIQITTGRATLT